MMTRRLIGLKWLVLIMLITSFSLSFGQTSPKKPNSIKQWGNARNINLKTNKKTHPTDPRKLKGKRLIVQKACSSNFFPWVSYSKQNPDADGKFTAIISGITGNAKLNIFNMNRQLVFNQTVTLTCNSLEVPVDLDVALGIYNIKFISNNISFTNKT